MSLAISEKAGIWVILVGTMLIFSLSASSMIPILWVQIVWTLIAFGVLALGIMLFIGIIG